MKIKCFPIMTLFQLQLSKALAQLVVAHRRQAKEVVEVRMLYRKEAMQRRILFNEVKLLFTLQVNFWYLVYV